VLVNNAGVAFKGDVFGAEECKATIDTNFRGTANACEALAPLLAEGRGRIINVSSGWAASAKPWSTNSICCCRGAVCHTRLQLQQ
jgi:NAD(P)-dependent dehydrogenase (short-subunit alcohol dehydrogenase family)